MLPVRHILVPTDFSPASGRALDYARDFARGCGATLHLLHVIEDPFAGGAYMGFMTAPPPGYFEQLDQRVHAQLASLLSEDDTRRFAATFTTRIGRPAGEILEFARDHREIDLIVLATSGHGAAARLLLGSVADRVARAASCPVLIVHAADVAAARRPAA